MTWVSVVFMENWSLLINAISILRNEYLVFAFLCLLFTVKESQSDTGVLHKIHTHMMWRAVPVLYFY